MRTLTRRLAVCALTIAVLYLCFRAGADLAAFAKGAAQEQTHGFPAYYTAARLVMLGETAADFQDWDWFRKQCQGFGFTATDVFWGNPPSAALLMLPLAGLSPEEARVRWVWLSLAFWFLGIVCLSSFATSGLGSASKIAFLALLFTLGALYDPFRETLHFAQAYGFLFLLLALSCALWIHGRPALAGVACGLIVALKGYGLPLVALAALRRDWRFVGGAAGGFGAPALAATILMGYRHWLDFVGTHTGDLRFSGVGTPALQTLKSLAIVALDLASQPLGSLEVIGRSSNWLLAALSLGVQVLLLVWLAKRRPAGPPAGYVLAACVAMGVILSPRAENYVYTLLMAALLLLVPVLRESRGPAWLLIGAGVLLSWPFHFQDRPVISGMHLLTDFPRLWGGVLLLAAAIYAEHQRKDGAQERAPQWIAGYAACAVGIALVLFYVKPWRSAFAGPLLAVSQTDADRVSFFRLDAEERKIGTTSVNCDGPFGLAFNPSRQLYAACTDDSHVSIVEPGIDAPREVFRAPDNPAWAQYRPKSDEVWISKEAGGRVTVFRSGTAEILAEIETGIGPSDITFDAAGLRAWVSNEGSLSVSLIDASAHRKIADIAVGDVPQGMVLTSDEKQLLVANFRSDSLSLIDLETGIERVQAAICDGPVDVALSGTAGEELAYVVCFNEGAVSVVDIDQAREIRRVSVGREPFGIAGYGGRLYVCAGKTNRLVVLEGGRLARIVRRIQLEGNPLQIAVAK